MEAGLAIAMLLATTIASACVAGYYRLRYEAVHAALIKSDDLASLRETENHILRMELNMAKERKR